MFQAQDLNLSFCDCRMSVAVIFSLWEICYCDRNNSDVAYMCVYFVLSPFWRHSAFMNARRDIDIAIRLSVRPSVCHTDIAFYLFHTHGIITEELNNWPKIKIMKRKYTNRNSDNNNNNNNTLHSVGKGKLVVLWSGDCIESKISNTSSSSNLHQQVRNCHINITPSIRRLALINAPWRQDK